MDLAELAIAVDVPDGKKAVAELNKVKNAASGLANKGSKEMKALDKATKGTINTLLSYAKGNVDSARQSLKAAQANKTLTKSELDVLRSNVKLRKTIYDNVKAKRQEIMQTQALADQEMKLAQAKNTVALAARRQAPTRNTQMTNSGGIANDLMPNRFNTANIAAQFQDVGVTAAMGMNPMTIALQQGTQLSAVINSMESPLKGLGQAFTSIINPVSLLSIGLVGLVAGLIQLVDWTSVAKSSLMFMADALEYLTPVIIASGLALTIAFAPTIVTGIYAISKAIVVMGASAVATGTKMAIAWAMANPVTALAAGFVIAVGLVQAFGGDSLAIIRNFVNNAIGSFLGFIGAVKQVFMKLPEFAVEGLKQTGNKVIEWVTKITNAVIDIANAGLEKLPSWLGGGAKIDPVVPALVFDTKGFGDMGRELANAIGQEFSQTMEKDYVGFVFDAVETGIQNVSTKLRKFASGLGQGDDDKKKKGKSQADHYADIVKGAEKRIRSLETERQSLTMTADAATRYQNKTDLLNKAIEKGIDLTPEQRSKLIELAGAMSDVEIETRNAKQAYDLLNDTGKGFITDLRDNLQEGKGLWESFSNSVVNALNKVLDKMFEIAAEDLFTSFSGTSQGGSILGGITDFLFNAKGNAFGSQGVQKFAKGDAFTNSVVKSPQMFAFATGGQFGVMGEAGPEAVMPLHRGSDGSLGVRVSGSSANNNVQQANVVMVNVENNGNSNVQVDQNETSGGIEIDVVIDEMVSNKIGTQGTSTNKSLKQYNNRKLINRG